MFDSVVQRLQKLRVLCAVLTKHQHLQHFDGSSSSSFDGGPLGEPGPRGEPLGAFGLGEPLGVPRGEFLGTPGGGFLGELGEALGGFDGAAGFSISYMDDYYNCIERYKFNIKTIWSR